MITVSCPSRYRVERKKIKEAVGQILINKGVSPVYDINIIFVGRNKMRKISQTYKHENKALPVLSFPYQERQEEKMLLGEIFICYPQAVILAAERNKKVDDIMLQLIKHGVDNLLK